MEYRHVRSSDEPMEVEVIELTTKNDNNVHHYAPPPESPPSDTKYDPFIAHHNREHYQPAQPPAKWPHSQKVSVAKLTPWRTTVMVFDVVLASAPIMFIVLAILAARLDNTVLTASGNKLMEILKISPTIYPIMFAAIMGRLFHALGLYLAERGTTLGRLEHLIGSQSIASALERLVCLRSWSLLSILTVVAWVPSPFGGQAALRLMKIEDTDPYRHNDTITETFYYIDPLNVQNSFLSGASSLNSGRSTFTSIFLAALTMSSNFNSEALDGWGNTKLPIYRSLEADTTGEWRDIPQYPLQRPTWASWIGIPVNIGLLQSRQSYTWTDFNVKARQFDITCSSNVRMSRNESDFGNVTSTWTLSYVDPELRCSTYPCSIVSKSLAPAEDGEDEESVSVAHCEVSYEYLEAEIGCSDELNGECSAKRLRKLDLLADGYSSDSDDFVRSVILSNLMSAMPTTDNIGVTDRQARGSTNMEKWMANPDDFIAATYDFVSLWNMTTDLFAERLTIVWNSFLQSTYAASAVGYTGAVLENVVDGETSYNATTVTRITALPTYQTNWKWLAVLLVCSTLLLAAGYVGLALKYLTIAPDIIGYASSLTLLNPYVPTPTGGTTLDGLERAALLHDLPIKIGDVCPNEPVGAIALAKADGGRVGNLDRRRLYV